VLLDENDQPKVTDFGLAKRIEKDTELTLSGQVLGSPNYMPPEQAAAHRGLVASVAMSIRWRDSLPSADGAGAVCGADDRRNFAAGADDGAGVADGAESAPPAQFEDDLFEVPREGSCPPLPDGAGTGGRSGPLAAEGTNSRPAAGRPEKVWRWCRRKPVIASLAVAVVLVFLLGFGGVLWQAQRASKAATEAQQQREEAQTQRDEFRRQIHAAQMSQAFRAWTWAT